LLVLSGGQGEVDADFEGDGVVGGEHLDAAFVETDAGEGDAPRVRRDTIVAG
jgi:hypothetical protein